MAVDVASTIATVKTVAAAVKASGKIELYEKVLSLQQDMLDAIAEVTQYAAKNAELTRQNIELQRQVDEAKEQLARRAKLIFRDDAYWHEDGEKLDGPFCPRCLAVDDKTVPMTDRRNGYNVCINCKYSARNYIYPEPKHDPTSEPPYRP